MLKVIATMLLTVFAGYCEIAFARYIEADPVGIVHVPWNRVVPVQRPPVSTAPATFATPRAITARDVLRQHQLNHSYAYVDGNPLSKVDPTGEVGLVGAGAAAGTMIFPGPGTLVGAGLGLGLSYLAYLCLKGDDCGKMLEECNNAIAVNKRNIPCFACFQQCQGQGKWPDRIPAFTSIPGNYDRSCAYW